MTEPQSHISQFLARLAKRRKPSPENSKIETQIPTQSSENHTDDNNQTQNSRWASAALNTIPNTLQSMINEPNSAVYAFLGITTLFAGAKLVNYVNDAMKTRNSEIMFDQIVGSSKIENKKKAKNLETELDILPFRGMKNLGATCYLNSLLQTLFHIKAFRFAVFELEKLRKESNGTKFKPDELSALYYIFHKLQDIPSYYPKTVDSKNLPKFDSENQRLQKVTSSSISTENLVQAFHWKSEQLYEPQDVQEVCRVLLELIEKKFHEFKQKIKKEKEDAEKKSLQLQGIELMTSSSASNLPKNNNPAESNGTTDKQLDKSMAENSLFTDFVRTIFGGKMKSTILCRGVDYKSENLSDFYDVQLALPSDVGMSSKKYVTLESCFENFVAKEVLKDDNKYDAGPVYGYVEAEKIISFATLPPVLFLHLKRFEYDVLTGSLSKLSTNVIFPPKIDFSKFVSLPSEDSSTSSTTNVSTMMNSSFTANSVFNPEKLNFNANYNEYTLFAVLSHFGATLSNGHYIAYINKKLEENVQGWVKFNDESVEKVKEEEVFEGNYSKAYMLVYVRNSDRQYIM